MNIVATDMRQAAIVILIVICIFIDNDYVPNN